MVIDEMGSTELPGLPNCAFCFPLTALLSVMRTRGDLKTLLAHASPLRSGDQLAGIAAHTQEQRVRAQQELADVPLTRFLEEPLIPCEQDEVTRLILDRHDKAAFGLVENLSVGQFREWF